VLIDREDGRGGGGVEGVYLIAVRREINMRVGGGRILLDGYQIGLYFLSEWFRSGVSSIHNADFNIAACSCYHRFRLKSSLGIGNSHTHFAYTMLPRMSRIEDSLARGSGGTRDRGKNC